MLLSQTTNQAVSFSLPPLKFSPGHPGWWGSNKHIHVRCGPDYQVGKPLAVLIVLCLPPLPCFPASVVSPHVPFSLKCRRWWFCNQLQRVRVPWSILGSRWLSTTERVSCILQGDLLNPCRDRTRRRSILCHRARDTRHLGTWATDLGCQCISDRNGGRLEFVWVWMKWWRKDHLPSGNFT